MEPASDAQAPDLELDDKSQYGFVQWYNSLPKVRFIDCKSARHIASCRDDTQAALHHLTLVALCTGLHRRQVLRSQGASRLEWHICEGSRRDVSLVFFAVCRVSTLCMATMQCSLQGSSTKLLLLLRCLASRMVDCLVCPLCSPHYLQVTTLQTRTYRSTWTIDAVMVVAALT